MRSCLQRFVLWLVLPLLIAGPGMMTSGMVGGAHTGTTSHASLSSTPSREVAQPLTSLGPVLQPTAAPPPSVQPFPSGTVEHATYLGVSRPPASTLSPSNPQGYTNGTHGWEGLDESTPGSCNLSPPDPISSVGDGYLFEETNLAGEMWNLSGSVVSSPFCLAGFFKSNTSLLSDPQVIYDPVSQRWFAEIFTVTLLSSGYVFLAVSASPNPTGSWYVYDLVLPVVNDTVDQCILATDSDVIALSCNIFYLNGMFLGNGLFLVNKTQAMAGISPAYRVLGPQSSFASLHPAHELSYSDRLYLLSDGANVGGAANTLTYMTEQGAPPNAVSYTYANFTTPVTIPSPAPQPGGIINTDDQRVESAVWDNGNLWGAATDGGHCTGGSTTCLHLWQLSTSGTGSVLQDYFYSPPGGISAFYPAVTLDPAGNLGLVYDFSSSSTYQSVAISGWATTDPVKTLETPTVVKQGTAQLTAGNNRSGDYSGASTDLTTGILWVDGEYVGVSGGGWNTWIQSFSFGLPSNPVVSLFTALPSPVPLGKAVYLNVTVLGGTGPYSYSYSGLPNGCTSNNTASLLCTSTVAGAFPVTVTVKDFSGKTASGNVTFSVQAPAPPGPTISAWTISPSTILLGGTAYFNTTAAGGTPPYSYAYNNAPPGCPASSSSGSISCTPTSAGTFPGISVTVTDSASKSITSGTLTLTVNPDTSKVTIASWTVAPSSIVLGSSTYFNVTATGGTGPYTYVYNILPAGCPSTSTVSLKCTPTAPGTYPGVSVTVTDSTSHSVTSSNLSLTVVAPLSTTLVASPSALTIGANVTLTTTPGGGQSPYTFSYSGLPSGCSTVNAPSFRCTPTVTGNFSITVTVTDSQGRTAHGHATLTVTATTPKGPSISSFVAQPVTVALGGSTTFSVSASGGNGTLSFAYTGLPSGCASQDVASFSCVPGTSGNFLVKVYVNDSVGHSANATTTLTVTSSGPALSTVTISPSPDTLPAGTFADFTATVVCNGATCPSGTAFYWSLTNNLVTLNSSTGDVVEVRAGNALGTVALYVNATLNHVTVEATAVITISASSSTAPGNGTGPSTFLGLPGAEGYMMVGVAIAGVVAVVGALLFRRYVMRHRNESHPESPVES